MREIKFRAWDGKRLIDGDTFIGGWTSLWPINEILSFDGLFVLEQYTGLKDKNGKEIYEGDILGDDGYYLLVFWDDEGAFLVKHLNSGFMCGDDLCMYCTNREIIGNIHENAELLDAQK